MRAKTKKKHKMGRRFVVVIGVAAAGVMALGAQAAAAPTYNTRLTISEGRGHTISGLVYSGGGKKCEVGRRVTLFKQQPGADRKIIDVRSGAAGPDDPRGPAGTWGWGVPQGSLPVKAGWRVYAKATPKVRDGFVCRGDRSPIWKVNGTKKVPKAFAGTGPVIRPRSRRAAGVGDVGGQRRGNRARPRLGLTVRAFAR